MAPFRRVVRPTGLSTRQTTPRHLWLAWLGLAARGADGARQAGARLQEAPARVLGALAEARSAWAARAATIAPRKRIAVGRAGGRRTAKDGEAGRAARPIAIAARRKPPPARP